MLKELTIPDIGLVLISKKTNATRLKIRIHPEKGVLVTIPYSVKFDTGEKFIYDNIDWIRKSLKKQKDTRNYEIFTPDSIFLSRQSKVSFIIYNSDKFKLSIKDNVISFFYKPDLIDFSKKEIQDFIKKGILKALELESKDFLIKKAEILSEKTNLKYRTISISKAGSRWGTCNTKNDIKLSCRLLLLPDILIDYIILHELCHIIHKNHGPKFYDLLDKLTNGNSKLLNKELKKHTNLLIPGDYRYLADCNTNI